MIFSEPVVLHSITLSNFYNDIAILNVPITEEGGVVLDNCFAAPLTFFSPVPSSWALAPAPSCSICPR